MKKILFIYIISLLFCSNEVFSQGISDPITGSTDPNNVGEIISDFGPRYVGDGHIYHSGIDYKRALYDPALAVETGDVTRIRSLGEDNAYIEVGNWWYMHIQDELTPTYNWEIINDGNNDLFNDIVIIRMTDFNGEIIPIAAYVSINSLLYSNGDIFPDPTTGKQVTLSTNIPQGDIVFRARNHPNGPHLHLQRKLDYWDNPLNYVPYNNSANPAFDAQVRFKHLFNGSFVEFNPIYGEDVYIESRINSQTDKDFDRLEIKYSKDNTTFSSLFDWTVSGPNHLDVDRQYGTSDNPKHVIHHYVEAEHTEEQIQSKAEEGIFPVNVDPCSIDYYKGIWNTQETETGSENVLNLKYLDGTYNIRATASDLTGNEASNTTNALILDNTCPYVKKVVARKGNSSGAIAYTGEWVWDGTALVFSSTTGATLYSNESIYVKVYLSEPMQSLFLMYGSYYPTGSSQNNGLEWEFTIPSNFIGYGSIELVFADVSWGESKDLAGNSILGFHPSYHGNSIQGTNIPIHQSDGTWNPKPSDMYYITDKMHILNIVEYIPGVPTNVQASNDNPDNITISWDDLGYDKYYQVYKGSSNTPISGWISSNSFVDNNVSSGECYDYKVKASGFSSGVSPSDYSSPATGCVPEGLIASFSYNQTDFSYPSFNVNFYDNSVSDISTISSWLWNFGDGNTSTSQNPVHNYYEKGTYNVSLRVTDNLGNYDIYTNTEVHVTEDYTGSIIIDGYYNYLGNNTYEFIVNVNDAGGRNYNIQVDYGDGQSGQSTGNFSEQHYYDEPFVTTTYYPTAFVIVDDPFETIEINYPLPSVTIEQSYTLNVEIRRTKDHVFPPDGICGFYAIVNGGTGNYRYDWTINLTPDDLSGICNPENEGCADGGSNWQTPDFTFPEEGNYKAHVYVWETDGVRQGSAEYVLPVGEAEEECIRVDIEDVGQAGGYEYALGSSFGLIADIDLNGGCSNYSPPNTIETIGRIEWFYDNSSTPIRKVEFTSDGEFWPAPNRNICLGEEHHNTLTTTGPHTIRVKVTGAYVGGGWGDITILDNYYTTVSKKIMVVDCESEINITNKVVLGGILYQNHNTVKDGYINLVPEYHHWLNPSATINIESGEVVNLIAYNSITLKPGVNIKAGSNFTAKIEECPLIVEDCEEYNFKSQSEDMELSSVSNGNSSKRSMYYLENEITAEVYPNPTKSSFTIELLGDSEMVQSIEIYNVEGQLIKSKESVIECYNDFDLSGYPQGVYFVKINNFDNQIVKKIIKQ